MKIKLLGMDVDGTLTDGKIYIGLDGEVMKAFNVKDGYGIVKFIREGGVPAVITGRKSKIVEQRCRELGITELYQGVSDKLACLKKLSEKYMINYEEIAFIGDDLSDIECLKVAKLSACPADAVQILCSSVDYVCKCAGGHGAVREFIDWFWEDNHNSH